MSGPVGIIRSFCRAVFLVATVSASQAARQEILDPELFAELTECVDAARQAGEDVGRCSGVVTERCLNSVAAENRRDSDRTFCLMSESFGWTEIGLRTGTTYLDRMDGRAGFSRDDHIAELEDRLSAGRDCFNVPIGQEERIQECVLDRDVGIVRWIYRLLDESEE